MIELQGRYELHLTDGSSLASPVSTSAWKVSDGEAGPEVAKIVVFVDGDTSTEVEAGRARLVLAVEIGSGRMRAVLHVPLAPGRDSNLVLDELTGSATLSGGVLRGFFDGRSRVGDVTLSGTFALPVGERPSAGLEPASVVMAEREVAFDLGAAATLSPSPLQTVLVAGLVPRDWRLTEATSMRLRLSHGHAVYAMGVGAAEMVGATLEREAQVARTRASRTARVARVVELAPHRYAVHLEGAREDAILTGYVGFPGKPFYVSALLAGVPDAEAWNERFAALLRSIREVRTTARG